MISLRDQARLRPIEAIQWENIDDQPSTCKLALTFLTSLRQSGPVIDMTAAYKQQTESVDSVDRLLEDLESFQQHLSSETFKNTSLYSKLQLGYQKAMAQGQRVYELAVAEIESIKRSKRLLGLYLSESDKDLESSAKVERLSQKCQQLQTWLIVNDINKKF